MLKVKIITQKLSDGFYRGHLEFDFDGVLTSQEITKDFVSANDARHEAENILRETVRVSHTERNLNFNQ